jgi:non-ribosomal peptide synthetase component F
VRQTILDAYEHQAYPFDKLVEELDLARDMSRSPVFDVSLGFTHAQEDVLRLGELKVSVWDQGYVAAKFDLSFDFSEIGDGLELAITYNTDLFGEQRMRRMAEHYVRLSAQAVENPGQAIGRMPFMSEDEEQQVRAGFNDADRSLPQATGQERGDRLEGSGETAGFVPPRDDLEHALAGFFVEVLRVERVGAEDNFFRLGGDSLQATQIVSRLREAFRAEISIPHLFRAGNVRVMAELVRAVLPEGRADKIAAAIRRLQQMSPAEKQDVVRRRSG